MARLMTIARNIESGKAKLTEHKLIEDGGDVAAEG